VSVAKLGPDGRLTNYPDVDWNAWRNAGSRSSERPFVCVPSVVDDDPGSLFMLDPGAPAIGAIVKGAPKLMRVSLASSALNQTDNSQEN